MDLIRLFPGPVAPPPRLYVHGVDRARLADRVAMMRLVHESNFLVALCAVPGTPFTGRFQLHPE